VISSTHWNNTSGLLSEHSVPEDVQSDHCSEVRDIFNHIVYNREGIGFSRTRKEKV
jgi:hypothetical protein